MYFGLAASSSSLRRSLIRWLRITRASLETVRPHIRCSNWSWVNTFPAFAESSKSSSYLVAVSCTGLPAPELPGRLAQRWVDAATVDAHAPPQSEVPASVQGDVRM